MESHARLYGYVQALVFGILKALGEILKKRIDHAIIRLFSILKMLTKESDAMYFAVNIVCDHVSGKSEGNVFVHYAEEIAASKALKKLMASTLEEHLNGFAAAVFTTYYLVFCTVETGPP
ncbi:uncharacterized protein LOC111393809 isoform X2 [Olea europaea var. sylvestris]|uniref:Glycine-rich RNA-binding 4, mitochondrial isoform X1 n=1 Tax=Olea europaea subsp. europaea TaxID=158383 RepID=A0A8S0S7L6_OLEEU|nr:uncharacterized protein LOC111393809 isoform X2 [Olea europaea var. sylvestris]CAA2987725.1 glycine-rich RNA-binding 4, mitochondrial isoform X1 [Olea europaea subsp. europaea]